MLEVKAPGKYDTTSYTIFLGGAIDQNKAVDWQSQVVQSLKDFDVTILNPRREEWDESWGQTKKDPRFVEQVLWEIRAQEDCDMCLYVFPDEAKAPITFFEYGAWGTRKDCLVCTEPDFYRYGNLDLYGDYFKVPTYDNLDELLRDLKIVLTQHGLKTKETA
jgi:hypothetical protein